MSTSASASSDNHPVLGNVIEICIATTSLQTTISELKRFGIGPWKVFTFDTKDNISNATIESRAAHFRLRVGFAQLTKDIAYEVIEPLDSDAPGGLDIFGSWLRSRGQISGIHHIAYDCHSVPWEERLKKFADMGAQFVQGGTWHGKKGICQFAWFKGSDGKDIGSTSTFFETIKFSEDWEDPIPDETY